MSVPSISKPAAFTSALLSIALLGVIDYVTGYEVSIFIFYAIPIVAVAWFNDKNSAILMALIAALVWWWADRLAMHPYRWGWLQAWESAVRLGFFIFAGISGSAIRAHHDAVEARIRLLEHSQLLEQQIVNISEEEQRRIGHDLHDGICQRLIALGFSASCLEKDLWQQGCFEWASSAKDLAVGLKNAAVETRDLARGLTPVQVDTAGLAGALQELAATIKQHVALDCIFDGNSNVQILDPAVANQLFRIAQEAVNNAVKHSNATRVELQLRANGPEGVELVVADNGIGFSGEKRNGGGIGLKIMSYRARSIQAALRISPNLPAGTLVCCDAPRSLTT